MKRSTIQRQIILDALVKMKTHPTVDEVYTAVQKYHPTISKTTVYRNLRGLSDAGIIHQISLPDSVERYDGDTSLHYHFKCRDCNLVFDIFDIEIDYVQDINNAVNDKYGYQVDRHDIVFTGTCGGCTA